MKTNDTKPTKRSVILSSNYFGNIQLFSHIVKSGIVVIEQNDHYSRQSYRNRTTIMAANGPMNLTVPVIKPKGKVKTKDILISYDTNWQKNHWRSIFSAYNSSPFFEYYKDDLYPVFEKQWKYLTELNNKLLELTLEMIEANPKIKYPDEYIENVNDYSLDLREVIHPKKDYKTFDKQFSPLTYRQVFSETMDFVPNLSILDLIFNKGPETYSVLEESLTG